MIRDYAKKRRSHLDAKPRARYANEPYGYQRRDVSISPMIWLGAGLLIGLLISGLGYWKLKTPKPIETVANTTTTQVALAQNTTPESVPETQTPTLKKSIAKKTDSKTLKESKESEANNRFDFYTVLPEGAAPTKVAHDAQESPIEIAVASMPVKVQPETKPVSTPVEPEKVLPTNTLEMALTKTEKPATVVTSTKPITTTAKATDDQQKYIIQVGSFTRLSPAEALKAQLALSGFETHIQTIRMGPRDTRYRVFVGPFENKDIAQLKQKQIEQAQQLHSLVLKFRV